MSLKEKNMIRKYFLVPFFLLAVTLVCAQSLEYDKANTVLADRGEVFFSFDIFNAENFNAEIESLTKIISIDDFDGVNIKAYANAREFAEFSKIGYKISVLTPPSMMFESILKNSNLTRDISEFDYYPTYDEYVDIMNQFAIDYPDLCEVVNIGSTTNGRDLLFIHINNDLSVAQNEPEFMYTSTMHGDELIGYILMLRLIDHLLVNYGIDAEITDIVNNIDIWINPNGNPDGTYAGGNNTVWGATRTNGNNIDLNRNYADPEDGAHPDGNAYQAETLAFMDFAENHNLVMSANIHSGAEVLNYPWDTWPMLHADDSWWVMVSREYADTCHAYGPYGYLTDLDNGITNGYAWYTTSGSRQDYMNYFHNCREVTMELSSVKMIPENELDDFWEYNYRSLINYIKQSKYGFSGVVTNAMTGAPVHAKVEIENHDNNNSFVYSNQPVGNYNRPIKQGGYNVTFSSFGYYSQTIENVPVVDYQNYVLNIELIPIVPLTAGFYASTTLTSPDAAIDFYDDTWGGEIVSWAWTFEGGTPSTSTDENPTGIQYNQTGVFGVSLTVTDVDGNTNTKEAEDYISVKQAFVMENETITTCDGLFYDSGSSNGDYADNEDYTMVFMPDNELDKMTIQFLEFDVENHFNCEYDYLEIYNGIDVSAPLLGSWCGDHNPGIITADNETGALTVYFHSNSSIVKPGWKAVVTCDSNVGIVDNSKKEINVFPNPAKESVNVECDNIIRRIVISDLNGRVMREVYNSSEKINLSVDGFNSGVYLLSIITEKNRLYKKLIIQ